MKNQNMKIKNLKQTRVLNNQITTQLKTHILGVIVKEGTKNNHIILKIVNMNNKTH